MPRFDALRRVAAGVPPESQTPAEWLMKAAIFTAHLRQRLKIAFYWARGGDQWDAVKADFLPECWAIFRIEVFNLLSSPSMVRLTVLFWRLPLATRLT